MKRALAVVVVLLVAAGGLAAAWWMNRSEPTWTTRSERALAAFQEAETDFTKLYVGDAIEHLETALVHDPDFVMAKLRLFEARRHAHLEQARVKELLDELRSADLERLTARERFLLRFYLAHVNQGPGRARELLDDYLEHHPDDPYGVELACQWAWERGEWNEAERCYQRLIRLDPNRVEAQNRLGYVAMGQGDFQEAERHLEIYSYLAPDQANPHDSLGELMLITGRLDEAETELRRALEKRPDFCASWTNLLLVESLRHRSREAAERLEEARAAGGCSATLLEAWECRLGIWERSARADWEATWTAYDGCRVKAEIGVAYLAARLTGRPTEAEEIVAWLEDEVSRSQAKGPSSTTAPTLDHLRALDAYVEGDAERASELARSVDDRLLYWSYQWLFKLDVRRLLARSLEASGHAGEAAEVRAAIRAVNPVVADHPLYPLPDPP